MMAKTVDESRWRKLAPRLRRALGLAPPTREEAEREMADAACFPMTDEEIERIVDYATKEPLTAPDPRARLSM